MARARLEDELETETSQVQSKTMRECLPYLGPYQDPEVALPELDVEQHIDFLLAHLQSLPPQYVGYDATRPWLVYWSLMGLHILGQDITQYRDTVVSTLKPLQNPSGGFGGSFGQTSHIACSYAATLSLIAVGGPEALDLINRKAMWMWLSSLKQQDGGFQTSVGGEEDVRGAYCAVVIISVLQLPSTSLHAPESGNHVDLLDGVCEYLGRCQTYEGGISASPGNEAHGGYAFCALACLCILGEPAAVLHRYLDFENLVNWLSARQHAPEGGFSGRTNKLVDACYSWWIGGCWPVIEAALELPADEGTLSSAQKCIHDPLLLKRYILCCCQAPTGGLRDKPSKPADAYHTCYTLAGLSSSHGHPMFQSNTKLSGGRYEAANQWVQERVNEAGRNQVHPLYVIPLGTAEAARDHFLAHGVEL